MSLAAIKQQQDTVPGLLDEALVVGGGSNSWMIQTKSGTFKAKKAFSCLVCPEIGDKVLNVSLASGDISILAILERKQPQTTQLKFEGNVEISATKSVRMLAGDRLDALARSKITLDSTALNIRATQTDVLFENLNVTGTEANHNIGKIQVIAKTIEMVCETSKQVMKNSFRLISGLDSVTADEVLQTIKKRFTLKSKQVSMLAEDDARLNGKRVHLG